MRNFEFARWTLGMGLLLALVVGLSIHSQALAVTIDPVAASDGPGADYFGSTELINGSGLSGVGDDSVKTHSANGAAPDMWVTTGGTAVNSERVTFDLGGTYNLVGTYIWAYNQTGFTGRGVKDFTIDVSTDGGATFNPIAGTFTVAIGTGANGESAQLLPFLALGVQQVRFDVVSNWNGNTNTNDLVGLSEVRFQVPEPTSVAGLLVGLAVLSRRGRMARKGSNHA